MVQSVDRWNGDGGGKFRWDLLVVMVGRGRNLLSFYRSPFLVELTHRRLLELVV
jgi:hypothetical protein